MCKENFKYEVSPTDGSANNSMSVGREVPPSEEEPEPKCGVDYVKADR